jgi:hypothetical protein
MAPGVSRSPISIMKELKLSSYLSRTLLGTRITRIVKAILTALGCEGGYTASGWYSDWRDRDCVGEQVHFAPTSYIACSGLAGALYSIRLSSAAQILRKSVELVELESFIRSSTNSAGIYRCISLYLELYSACKIHRASRSS